MQRLFVGRRGLGDLRELTDRVRGAVLAAALFAIGTIGCAKPPPVATAGDAARAQVALGELERGRTLLINKCGGCHRTPQPADLAPGAWPREVDRMAGRANVERGQQRLIELYLVTLAARE